MTTTVRVSSAVLLVDEAGRAPPAPEPGPAGHARPVHILYEGELMPTDIAGDRLVVVDFNPDGTLRETVSYSRHFQVVCSELVASAPEAGRPQRQDDSGARNDVEGAMATSVHLPTGQCNLAVTRPGATSLLSTSPGSALVVQIQGVTASPKYVHPPLSKWNFWRRGSHVQNGFFMSA